MQQSHQVGFTGLINLASEGLGATVLGSSDEFFAEATNLVKDAPAVFLPDEYTDRGKWMDGWESRRKRGEGHDRYHADQAILRLGVPGSVRAIDIDTAHFLGNHPPFAELEGIVAPSASTYQELRHKPKASDPKLGWAPLLNQIPLGPGRQNLFLSDSGDAITHVRLSIFPDGGVARLRLWGHAAPSLSEAPEEPGVKGLWSGEVDLVALRRGGKALACSDAFFGPMNNLLAPGRAANMGGGWETKRRRTPGSDWILLELGEPGKVGLVEVDTNHFKGNFPDRCALWGIYAPGARTTELIVSKAWKLVLPESKLTASERHFFRKELKAEGPFTHVRLEIFPDGGVSRLRIYGKPSPTSELPLKSDLEG
ncbi:MAG: allantoicase [Polyangiaceae bacterium]|nr:allantoicase [Polyangiaceae bacterium]